MLDKYFDFFTFFSSPVGELILTGKKDGISGLYVKKFYNFKNELIENNNIEIFKYTKFLLEKYFNNEIVSFNSIPLKIQGSDFQKEIWEILKSIPYGKTLCYGEIAAITAQKRGVKKMSAQAVGSAISANPVLIIIPCHRVINKNNTIGGFSCGIKIKEKLLILEGNKVADGLLKINY